MISVCSMNFAIPPGDPNYKVESRYTFKSDASLLRLKPHIHLRGVAQVKIDGEGLFKVEMIDPWLMKVYPLGYVQPGVQAFRPFMAPSLFRLIRVERADPNLPTGSLTRLFHQFFGI